MNFIGDFVRGLWKENPVLVLLLGMCPTLATTSNAINGLGMGLGFTLALTVLGATREFLSSGSLFDVKVITAWTVDFMLPTGAPGAFIILGCFLALMNYLNARRAIKRGEVYVPPQGLDCRHCSICDLGRSKDTDS